MRHALRHRHSLVLATASATAAGQAAGGSIVGKVTDATGAALPGVTVTVSGPAVMGSPEMTSNAQGEYRFPSLPPGTYKLAFALQGFSTLVRNDIVLSANFTATVDAPMQLSSVTETVQVSGLSPVVDTVNTHVQTTWTADVLASVPAARDLWSILSQSPAIQMVNRFDVGGSTAGTQTSYVAYGVAGQTKSVVEGVIALEGSNSPGFYYDYGSFEEVNIGAASQGADMATPGVQAIFVSKSGGNTYHGDFFTSYESHNFEGHNIDADQLAKGVTSVETNRIDNIRDLNASIGGFLVKDQLWWFGSYRRQHLSVAQPNLLNSLFLTDLSNGTGKLTYQVSKNNKLVGYMMYGVKHQPYRMVAQSVTGSTAIYNANSTIAQVNPGWVWKGEWNRTFSDKMFLEARFGWWADRWHYDPHTTEARREDVVSQVVTGGAYTWFQLQNRPQSTGALSYYADGWGAKHSLKFGWELQKEDVEQIWYEAYPNNVVNVFRSDVPNAVYLELAPLDSVNRLYWYGFYVTDTVTRGPVTFNLGARVDHYRSAYPAQTRAANQFAPAASYSAADNLVTWNKVAPRFGVSLKVDDKSVVKANFSRYYFNPSLTVPNAVNPNQTPQWNQYNWTDVNGDRMWQPGEERALISSKAAGSPTTLSPALQDPHTNEVAAWYEREIGRGFAMHTGAVYRQTTDLFQTVNAVAPFSAFNVPTTAVDPVTGSVLNLFNLQADLVGKTLSTLQNAPGWTSNAFTFEVAANRRFSGRWAMEAAYATSWRNDISAIPVNPNQPAQSGMLPLTTAKLSASVEPGLGFRLSPVIRFQQGDPFARTLSVRLNYGNENVFAEPLGAERKDNVLLADVRAERKFKLTRNTTVGVFLDAYNIFNSNAATNIITTTGTSFLRPSTIVAPRVFQLGAKFSF